MMEYIDHLRKQWMAVARSTDVKRKPVRILLLDVPIVLVRIAGTLSAFIDVCPHRNAPLSAGKIENGKIVCPYHGWQFDQHGICQNIPGLCNFQLHQSYNIQPLAIYEKYNLIWLKLENKNSEDMPYINIINDQNNFYNYVMTTELITNLTSVIENFLDGTHTHFVHNLLIRSKQAKRQVVTAQIYKSADRVEIHYIGEPTQTGIIFKCFERERTLSIARFISPTIAELEYQSPSGVTMIITVYFTPTHKNHIKAFIIITFRKSFIPSKLKELIITPFLKLAIIQDKKILEQQTENILFLGKEKFINTEIDLIRPYILRLLSGANVTSNNELTVKEVKIEL